MPRSRGSETHQRNSPRVPLHLKATVCSEANGAVRHSVDRSSPKASPRHEKKRGSRITDLETKLTQTQEELRKLKEQLASAEAAKRDAQQELEETRKLVNPIPPKEVVNPTPQEQEEEEEVVTQEESINSPATDVFEVVVPTESFRADEAGSSKEEAETKAMIEEDEDQLQPKSDGDDMSELSAKMTKIETEINGIAAENENLKKQVEEASAASKAKEEEMSLKLVNLGEELKESRISARMLEEKLEEVEGAKEALETEMKRLRVQTEQWRKAAEAAAAVLASGGDGNGGKVGERCGSMEKHIGRYGGVGLLGSPGIGGGGEPKEDGLGGGGKRRGGGGMKMFGELWKKKGQK